MNQKVVGSVSENGGSRGRWTVAGHARFLLIRGHHFKRVLLRKNELKDEEEKEGSNGSKELVVRRERAITSKNKSCELL